MKILVFTTLFPNKMMPNHGVFVKHRIMALAKEHEIVVVAPVAWHKSSHVPLEEEIDRLRVYHPRYFMTPKIFRSLYGFFMFLSVYAFMKRLKKKFDFDIIDAHFVYPDGLAGVLLGKALGKKVIVTARGTDINWYPQFRIIRKLIQWTLKRADFIISVSNSLKEEIIKLGISVEKIKVIPNGVDTNTFFMAPKKKSEKIILSIGNLLETKGFRFLIEALSLIRRKDVSLFIIGEGSYRGKLERLIKKFNLEDRVKLLGIKPQKELYKWYSMADVFCLTSLREGRPNVVLEALACGTPVVTMDKWDLSDFVNEDRGILLDSYKPEIIAESIEKALKKKWDRENISSAVENFSWDRTAESVYEIFKKEYRKNDILFFSSDDWHSGLKTSKYHLSVRLAENNRVFFINSLSLRTPQVSKKDVKKILVKLKNFFKGPVEVRKNLFVYTPIIIPFQGLRVVRFINNLIVDLQIKSIMHKFRVKNPFVWTFLPNSLGVVRKLKKKSLIYYCVDDMSAFNGVPKRIISRFDDELTKEADFVFTVSRGLFNKKRSSNKRTYYSPHGVDFQLFNRANIEKEIERPEGLERISKPIIGFYGLISKDWVDYELIRFLAERRPEWSFVLIGKIDERRDGLPRFRNIYYLSIKPYEELYKYSRYFDVAMLPFNMNQLTVHSHPLKILEYLSVGKPVVSVNIPEVSKYENMIEVASNHEEFLEKLEKCLKADNQSLVKKRIEFASENTWEKRFEEILNKIYEHVE